MKQVIARFIAVLLLVIPGISATYGFLLLKNTLFAYLSGFGAEQTPGFQWLTFLLGLVLFFGGIAFIAGWIFFRDRKRNYVAPRFKAKRPRTPRPGQNG
ncbi:hypothetical protein BG53_01600 [Paenibacillus darwinianus]|uniref:DUF2627 domain-containing protein n=1 Tax=Paenibacillus darwinianus TaxID=1380763 RepID=A0A9W5W7F4_9BACL|nr:DUF2627 domain-containing protein [Paenibacillus darwinianus]EXX88327.1 hypothetical protein BG52_02320 [Paenibacillus darwinianus]EXX88639.1 hypothetical protein BG53_01600 [Paenibacillus darwinianus]EXX91833.1 hypothetical protein CH50_12805 [Paenibacillus darwinianus]